MGNGNMKIDQGKLVEEEEIELEEPPMEEITELKLEDKPLNYADAFKRLEESSIPLWKPEAGSHWVKFTSELREKKYNDKQTGKLETRCVVDIEVKKGEKYLWMFGLGGQMSTYGQLLNLIQKRLGGSLKDKVLLVSISLGKDASGKVKRTYVISDGAE